LLHEIIYDDRHKNDYPVDGFFSVFNKKESYHNITIIYNVNIIIGLYPAISSLRDKFLLK